MLIAGLATSSVGAATNITTSMVEKILNSRQIKEMNAAFERDKDITLKLEAQIEDVRRYKDSAHLTILILAMQNLLGPDHLLVILLRGVLVYDFSSSAGISAGILGRSTGLANTEKATAVEVEDATSLASDSGALVAVSAVKTEAALAGTLLERGGGGIR